MTITERLDAIEARALAPWSVQGVGQSLSDAVDLVTALRAVLDLHRPAGRDFPYCAACDVESSTMQTECPCPTVRAIEEVLS